MIVEQSLSKTEIEKTIKQAERQKVQRLKTAAFRDWQHKQNPNDQLPRGRFFKGKKAGKPVVIMDEFHMTFKQPSNPFPYQPTGSFDANFLVTKS